ncbi:MAG: FAD-binding oxidoreductase [Gemmatimonadetes bacterium]|nr:FAD-binding oxidoreductase [Gemmatimonadota bacterium]
MKRLGEAVVAGTSLGGRLAALALARRGLPVVLVGPSRTDEAPESWYRAWWPGQEPALTPFLSRGIDLLEALWEESHAGFDMDRRGELWLAGDPPDLEFLRAAAGRATPLGVGPLREHTSHEWYLPSPPTGLAGSPGGLDLIEGGSALRAAFGKLELQAAGGLHVRRAGAVDGDRFGRWLDGVLAAEGVTRDEAEPVGLDEFGGFQRLRLGGGRSMSAGALILAHGAGLPLEGWARVSATLSATAAVGDTPALRCRGTAGDWLELVPASQGWTAVWRTPVGAIGSLPDRVAVECRQAARLIGRVADGLWFSTGVSTVRTGPGGRPVVGLLGQLVVTAGHGGSIPSALAAAEAVAEYVLEARWPRYAQTLVQPAIAAAAATTD